MLPGQLFGSSHLDSSQGKQTRARVPDSPSSRASRNSHPAAARCQPPSPPGRLLPAETAARYIPAAAARPGPGGASRKPPRRAADPSVPRLLPAAPASGPPRKVSSLGGGGFSQTSPPGGGSARCPLREAASVSPSVPGPPAPGGAAPCVRAAASAAAAALALSPARPESRLASCLPLAPLQVRPLPCPHWATIASAPPRVPVRAALIGHGRGWPAPFLPRPPSPRSWGWKRRSGGEEQPGPHSGRRLRLPLHLPSPSGATGAEQSGAAAPDREDGPAAAWGTPGAGRERAPQRAQPQQGDAAGSREWGLAVPGRGGESLLLFFCPLPRGARGSGTGSGSAPRESRAGRSPPRPTPAAGLPGAPRCPAGAGESWRTRSAGAGGAVPLRWRRCAIPGRPSARS